MELGEVQAPSWTAVEAVAHTLVYDSTISNDTTADVLTAVSPPR